MKVMEFTWISTGVKESSIYLSAFTFQSYPHPLSDGQVKMFQTLDHILVLSPAIS